MYEINIVKCQKGIHDENDAFSRYKQQINFIALVTRVLRYQNMTISPLFPYSLIQILSIKRTNV